MSLKKLRSFFYKTYHYKSGLTLLWLTSSTQRGIQVKFFNIDQNVGKSLQYILPKFKLSTSSVFTILYVQN